MTSLIDHVDIVQCVYLLHIRKSMTRFARDTRWPLNLNQTPSQLYKRRSAEANHALSTHWMSFSGWLKAPKALWPPLPPAAARP